MKTQTLVVAVVGIGLVGALSFYAGRSRGRPPSPVNEAVQSSAGSGATEAPAATTPSPNSPRPSPRLNRSAFTAENSSPTVPTPETAATPAEIKKPVSVGFTLTLDTLVNPQATFEQRQSAWKQLREAGKLDQTITELEQRATTNTTVAAYPAALGQAYLFKAGTIQDVREQGILGLKADQAFEDALKVDANNWDARFWKANAMSYWPSQMNKGREVAEQFVELIKQQEAQAPQPHFAQTYAVLGDIYKKWGYADYSKQVWQRGAGLFPQDTPLKEKLVRAP